MEKVKLKVFMCTHKPLSFLPPYCVAVQGGAAVNKRIPNTLADIGAGGSISKKNAEYCENTVIYYAYKNENCDFYGFCHYRRFFLFDADFPYPYDVVKRAEGRRLSDILRGGEIIEELIQNFEVILPRAEDLGLPVREQSALSDNCCLEDFDLFICLLKEKYPILSPFADLYISGTKQYLCNMFVMKRDIFFDYCRCLFSLLSDFDEIKRSAGEPITKRTNGYISERFLGIYVLYLKSKKAKIYECQRIDCEADLKRRLSFRLFPPESGRRFFLKSILVK